MDIINSFIFLNVLFNGSITFLIFFRRGKFTSQKWFLWFTGAITLWCISIIFYRSATPDNAMIWAKNLYASAAIIPASFILFSASFPDLKPSKLIRVVTTTLTLIMVTLIYSNNIIIESVEIVQNGENIITWGKYYPIFVVYTPALFLTGFQLQMQKFKTLTGIYRAQIVLVYWGSMITSTLAMITNLLLPTFGNFSFNWFGQISTFIWIGFTSYAIFKHKLLDTRLILGKIIYYIILAILPYTIFNVLAYFYETYLGTSLTTTAYLIGIPMSLLFVFAFNEFKIYLQNYTNTKLINPGYNPLEVASRFNSTISGFLQIEKIAGTTLETLQKTIRPNYIGMVVVTNTEPFQSKSFAYKDQETVLAEKLQFIIDFWPNLNLEPLVYESLDYSVNNKYRHAPHIIGEVKQLMEELNLRAFIPVTQDDSLEGILLLGSKEADTPYTSGDVKFLTDIANTVSLSLGRALLYDKSLEFTRTLERRVEEATEELKDKNETLEDALVKLEDSRRQERDMIDVMGHELRTPLSIVRNALIVLDKDFKKDRHIEADKLERYLRMGIESIRREVKLVETLLSATKFEGNRIQLQLTKVDLIDVVNDSIEGQKHRASEKNLKIIFDDPKKTIEIYVDRVRVQEIMDNFLSNAIKYTAEGTITIELVSKDSTWLVNVVDTGIGISPDDIGSLGKKFFRAKKIFGEKDLYVHPSGTGLGLYVTFQLIEVMGGQRYITSEIGKGSTFAFELPKYAGQEDKMIDQTFLEDKTIEKLREETGKVSTEKPDDYIVTNVPGKELPDAVKE